jgi:hypothetical protein
MEPKADRANRKRGSGSPSKLKVTTRIWLDGVEDGRIKEYGFGERRNVMIKRRDFLLGAVAAAGFALSKPTFGSKSGSFPLGHKERVDRALLGQGVDRPPYTFYHHYKRPTAQRKHRTILIFIGRIRRTS